MSYSNSYGTERSGPLAKIGPCEACGKGGCRQRTTIGVREVHTCGSPRCEARIDLLRDALREYVAELG